MENGILMDLIAKNRCLNSRYVDTLWLSGGRWLFDMSWWHFYTDAIYIKLDGQLPAQPNTSIWAEDECVVTRRDQSVHAQRKTQIHWSGHSFPSGEISDEHNHYRGAAQDWAETYPRNHACRCVHLANDAESRCFERRVKHAILVPGASGRRTWVEALVSRSSGLPP